MKLSPRTNPQRLHHTYQWITSIEEVNTIMTPDLILTTHNDGERKVDVDCRSRHGDDWGRTLRGEERMIDEGKEKRTEERNQPLTNH